MSDIIQGSPEWFQQRLGKVTASRVADVVARTKSGWGASRANYEAQLIAERLTGEVSDSYQSAAMERGNEIEGGARTAYEFYRMADVVEVGFMDHPSIRMSGASPDGLVGDDGLVEFKCPNTATHLATLLGKNIAGNYMKQMQWQMDVAERQWCDFCSFDPRMPEAMRLHVIRVQRDDEMIKELRAEINIFLVSVENKIDELSKRFAPPTDIPQHPLMAG